MTHTILKSLVETLYKFIVRFVCSPPTCSMDVAVLVIEGLAVVALAESGGTLFELV